MFEEKSWYLKNFLLWYHLMRAKTSTSRSTTMKTPPKKASAGEELELVAVHGIGVVVVGGGVDGSSLGELELVALEEVGSATGAIELELVVLEVWVVLSTWTRGRRLMWWSF